MTSHCNPDRILDSSGPAGKLVVFAIVLTALTYIGTLRYEFVFDDYPVIVRNPLLRDWHSIPHYFAHHLWAEIAPGATGSFYRPIFLVWFLLNFKLFGLDPAGWHATTLGMHLLVTFLVFRLARHVVREGTAAAIAALLFGLHPSHIESVAWICGVSDPLMAVLLLGGFLCWINFRQNEQPSRWWICASLTLGGAALLAKETAIVLPGLVAAYEFWMVSAHHTYKERLRLSVLSSLPFFLLDAIYLIVRKFILGGVALAITPVPVQVMAWTGPSLLWFYVRHLGWPVGLSAFYDTPYISSPGLHTVWLPMAGFALVVCVLGWIFGVTRSGAFAFACVFILLPVLPALNLRAFQYAELAHDRYLYLASIGYSIVIALGAVRLGKYAKSRGGRTQFLSMPLPLAVMMMGLAMFFAVATAVQNRQWATTLTLYSRAVQIAPGNINAVLPLAREFLRRGENDLAVPYLKRATLLVPGDWSNYFVLGHTLYGLHRYQEAAQAFEKAIALDPNNAAEFYFLGLSRLESGHVEEAERPLRQAIGLLPSGHGLHEALAQVLISKGKWAEARAELAIESRIDPQNRSAQERLAALNTDSK